jgi:hypothetical protein
MTIAEQLRTLFSCERDHDKCTCAGTLGKAVPPKSPRALLITRTVLMLAYYIECDWAEAILWNEMFDTGARGWMRAAFAAPAPSEVAR